MSERIEDPENPDAWVISCGECGNMNEDGDTRCELCGEALDYEGQFKVYVPKNFKPATLSLIRQAAGIISEYERQDYKLSLRQLYYQFVSRDIIPNTNAEYKKLGSVITDARLAGLISFEAIEDRNRVPDIPYVQESHQSIANATKYHFNAHMWKNQIRRVEVWVEKDALSSVVERACRSLRTPYLACKGYMSSSAMWASAQRAIAAYDKYDQDTLIIHLGDHDPSGIDMTRDNQDRMDLLADNAGLVTVDRIALNMDQIERYDPPPNPAKVTDSRAKVYMQEHGDTSWELDALEPSIIEKLITTRIQREIDDDVWENDVARERSGERVWSSLGRNWPAVRKFLSDLEED